MSRLGSRALASCLSLGLLLTHLPASAQETGPEVRVLKLVDGRSLVGFVVEANAEGMMMEVPQGHIMVPYGSLAEIEMTEADDYDTQPPLRIALAPTGTSTSADKALARSVDTWLPDAAALVPATEVTSAADWARSLAERGTALHRCNGEVSCLRELAVELEVDRLLIARLEGSGTTERTLRLTTVITSTGATLKPSFSQLQLRGGEAASNRSAPAVVGGVFETLGFSPQIDVAAVAAAAFPTEGADELVSRGGEATDSETTSTAEGSGTEIATRAIETRPLGGKTVQPGALRLRVDRRQAVGLAFLPIPGFASAALGDPRGFALSLAGTIALSWVSVYAIGKTARSTEAFWVPTILAPYAICVAMGQLSIALGGKWTGAAKVSRRPGTTPPVSAGLAPVFRHDPGARGRPDGATLVLGGRF